MTPEQVLAAHEQVTISSPQQRGSRSTLPKKISPGSPSGLTTREVEVLRLVAQGMTDAQIAEHLVISPRTVTTHLTSIYNKLAVNSRVAAARFAIEHNLT
jgi:DNA-binding NarL/FixJ family response regulator